MYFRKTSPACAFGSVAAYAWSEKTQSTAKAANIPRVTPHVILTHLPSRTTAESFPLVILGDQPVEQAQAKAAGALRHGVAVLLRPGDAGDVEMRPRRLADEALEELRGGDRAGAAVADVLHIGNVGLDDLVVFLAERQPPHRLAGGRAGLGDALGEVVVVGEQTRLFVAEGNDDRPGQRRQINHEARPKALLAVPQR